MSSPLWMETPVELVLLVFIEAARAALAWKASWITELSLVSRATYHAVTPILYETLVITDLSLIARLAEEEQLMKYVRRVCIVTAYLPWYPKSPIICALSRETIHTFDTMNTAQLRDSFRPRRLNLHNSTLQALGYAGLNSKFLASVTHLSIAYQRRIMPPLSALERRRCGRRGPTRSLINPPDDSSNSEEPTRESRRRDPLYSMLDASSALTHLSLGVGHQSTPLPGEELRILIIKILEACPRLHVFALHVMGHWDLVASLVAPVHDSRIRVWFDRRIPSSAGEELALRIRDARMGCNVWTQAEPLHHDLG